MTNIIDKVHLFHENQFIIYGQDNFVTIYDFGFLNGKNVQPVRNGIFLQ